MRACRSWKSARTRKKDYTRVLSSWEYSIHERDKNNNPVFQRLRVVYGLAYAAKSAEAKTLGATGKKEYSRKRIDAVPEKSQERANKLITEIQEAWENMPW